MDDLSALEAQTLDAAKQRDKTIDDELASLDESKKAMEQPRTRGWFADVGASAIRGVTKAVAAIHDGAGKLVDRPSKWLGEHLGDVAWTDNGIELMSPSQMRAINGRLKLQEFVTGQPAEAPVDKLLHKAVDAIGAPETKTGNFTQGVSQFVAGMIPVSRGLKGLNVLQGGARATVALRGILGGAITSGTAFESQEGNLANLVQDFPSLQNPVTNFLAVHGDDTEAVGRLKNAVTDMGGGALFETFLTGLRGLKNLRKVRSAPQQVAAEAEAVASTEHAPDGNIQVSEGEMTDEQRALFENLGRNSGRSDNVGGSAQVRAGAGGGNGPQTFQVFRGAGRPLSEADFSPEALGHASGKPAAGSGVFFTAGEADAARHGDVSAHTLTFNNPKVFQAGEYPGFDSKDAAIAFQKELQAQGHDGIILSHGEIGAPDHYIAFSPKSVQARQAVPPMKIDFEPHFTTTEEPLKPTPVKVDAAAAAARDARANKLSLETPEQSAARVDGHVAKLEQKAEALKAEVEKSKPIPVKALSEDEHYAKLREDLGISDEKLNELRKQITDGTIEPEKVTKLLGINPDRINWNGVHDAEDMVGLMNAMTRLTNDAAGKARFGRVSVETVAHVADEMGGSMKDAVQLWERLKANGGVEAGIMAQRITLMASAAKLQRLRDAIVKGTNTPQDLLDFVMHDRRHALLQVTARGSRAMIGRALRMMRESVNVNEDALKLANGRRLREARKATDAVNNLKTGAEKVRAKAEAFKAADAAEAKALTDEQAYAAATDALAKAHDARMASELKAAKAATKEAASKSREEAKAARKEADRAEREAKAFEDLNAKANDAGSVADVNPEAGVKMQLDEVERALAGMGYRTEDVVKLAKAMEKIDGMVETHAAARSGLWQTLQERVSTLFINNALSGIPTMVTNIASGWYKLIESTVEQFGAAGLSTLRGGDRFDRMIATKSTVAAWSSWHSAWQLAGKAWKEGIPQTDILAKAEVAIRGGTPQSWAGKAITLPSRAIITIDEFFKHIFYKQELTARSVEVASSAARLQPTRAAQDRMFKQVFEDTMNHPPDDLVLDAIEASRYNTFQSNLDSKIANSLIKLTNDTPITKLIVPFIKTPGNIVKQGFLERSPLALARKKVWQSITEGGREGNVTAVRTVLGTLAVASVWEMADRGLVTGSQVGNGPEKNTADLSGAPPYSAKIGGTWYQFSRLDPIGMVLGMTADLRLYYNDYRARSGNNITSDDPNSTEWFGNLLAIVHENMLDKTYFKGFSDFFDAMRGGSGSGTKAGQYGATMLTNMVPYASLQRQLAKANDEYAREAWSFADKLMQQTLGASSKLPPKIDVLGRPIHNVDRLGADWMSPFVVGKDDPDPAAKALAELHMDYRMPNKQINGIQLSPEQYSHLLSVRGSYIKQQLDDWLKSGEWAGLSKYQRQEKFQRWENSATSQAKAGVLEKWPDLANQVGARREEIAALKSGELGDNAEE